MRGYYAATLLTQRQVGSASGCGHASRGPWLIACHRSAAISGPSPARRSSAVATYVALPAHPNSSSPRPGPGPALAARPASSGRRDFQPTRGCARWRGGGGGGRRGTWPRQYGAGWGGSAGSWCRCGPIMLRVVLVGAAGRSDLGPRLLLARPAGRLLLFPRRWPSPSFIAAICPLRRWRRGGHHCGLSCGRLLGPAARCPRGHAARPGA